MDITYNPDVALRMLADKISQLELDNAILRAALLYVQAQDQDQKDPPAFSSVPYSDMPSR